MAWSERVLGQSSCLQHRNFIGRGQNGDKEMGWLINAIVQMQDDEGQNETEQILWMFRGWTDRSL